MFKNLRLEGAYAKQREYYVGNYQTVLITTRLCQSVNLPLNTFLCTFVMMEYCQNSFVLMKL